MKFSSIEQTYYLTIVCVFGLLLTKTHLVRVVPAKDIRSLKLKWYSPQVFEPPESNDPQLNDELSSVYRPSTKHMYKSKPGSSISFVLGHEGPNSLLSYLIKLGLATSLSTDSSHILSK